MILPAIAILAGISLQNILPIPAACWLSVMPVSCCIGIFAYIRNNLKAVAISLIVCCICLGAVRLIDFTAPAPNDIRLVVTKHQTLAVIRGVVKTKPRQKQENWVFSKYSYTKPKTSFYLKLTEIRTDNGFAPVTGTIKIYSSEYPDSVFPGDLIQACCMLGPFSSAVNPGQFDLKKYFKQRNIFISASINSAGAIEIIKPAPVTSFSKIKTWLSEIAAQLLLSDSDLDSESSSIASALLLGQRGQMRPGTIAAFQKTGLAHFISLSGMHLAILTGFIWQVSKLAGLNKRGRALTCIILIAFYMIIIPPRAPAIRAAILCWFICASVLVRQKPNTINALSLSAIVVLLINPFNLFSPGWQLSYATVLGIILFHPHIKNFVFLYTVDHFERKPFKDINTPAWRFLKPIVVTAAETMSVGFSAWLGGAGILLFHFKTITPLACLWTVIIFPLITAILALGFTKILLAIVAPTLAMLLGVVLTSMTNSLAVVVVAIARLDISQINIGKVSWLYVALLYSALLYIRFGSIYKSPMRKHLAIAFAVVLVAWPAGLKYTRSHRNHLELSTLSVGHGQAVILQLPGTENILFDAGSLTNTNIGPKVIVPFLREYAITKLDTIFISHDDIDHINAIPEIVSNIKTQSVSAGNAFIQHISDKNSTASLLEATLREKNLNIRPVAGNLEFKSEAKITSIWPSLDDQNTNLGDNNMSQVFLIEYAGRKILITGDIETHAQKQILDRFPELTIDVLIMPHHGSTKNLLEGFIESLSPKTLIISCSHSRRPSAYEPTSDCPPVFYTPGSGCVKTKIKADGSITTIGYLSDL